MACTEVERGNCKLGAECEVYKIAAYEMEAHWQLRDKKMGQEVFAVAELKLIKIRDIPNVAYIKKYEYGEFAIRVEIIPDDTYFICAENKSGIFEITAANNAEPMLTSFMLALTNEMLDKFVDEVIQAKELMDIIENNRDELLRKEQHGRIGIS